MQTANAEAECKSSLEGLWILLVNQETNRIPMMARAGNDETYLLGFKNMFNARKFIAASDVANAEPRMVVKGNKAELLRVAQTSGAVGVLVDYDPTTHDYASATELY